jgi:hypothetical protein
VLECLSKPMYYIRKANSKILTIDHILGLFRFSINVLSFSLGLT